MQLTAKSENKYYCHWEGCYNLRRSQLMCPPHEQRYRQGRSMTLTRNQHTEPWDYPVCQGPECDRPGPVKDTYCTAHAVQLQRGVELHPLKRYVEQIAESCTGPACDRPVKTHNFCSTHYSQFWKYGQTWELGKWFDCAVDGCSRTYTRHSPGLLCKGHKVLALRYGLSEERMIEVFAGAKCHICGERPERALHIDHDHACCPSGNGRKCGECVRGLLCMHCNHMIGNAKEDPKILMAAIAYLGRHRESVVG